MSSPAPNERIVNKNLKSSNVRGHRNNISFATAVATCTTVATTAAAVTPQRAMQSVQDAFIGIVAEKDEFEVLLQEAQMEIERLRELLNAKDVETIDLENQLQEAQNMNNGLEKTFWATDAENHALKADNEDLIAENHTLKADKEDLITENHALKAYNEDLIAEKHALEAEVKDVKVTNARLTNARKMDKKAMVKKDKKIKVFRHKTKTLALMLAREGGKEYRLSEY